MHAFDRPTDRILIARLRLHLMQFGKNLPLYNAFLGRLQQTRISKSASITKDTRCITSQHSDILTMCCKSNTGYNLL